MLRGILGAVPHHEAPERNPFKVSTADERGFSLIICFDPREFAFICG